MDNVQIVTMPGSNEQFTVGTDGQLLPYVGTVVKTNVVPVGNAPTEPLPSLTPDVDLTAPVEHLRGQQANVTAIDDTGFTNKADVALEANVDQVKMTDDLNKVVDITDAMASVHNTVVARVDVKVEETKTEETTQSDDTQNSEESKYNEINAINLANIKYKITSPVSIPIDPKATNANARPIYVPMATQADLDKITQNLPTISDDVARTLNKDWVGSFYSCIEDQSTTDSFAESMKIPGSMWTQRIEFTGQNIGPKRAAIGDIRDQKLTGAAAIYHMQNLLNAGTSVTHPLWASGLWLTLRNPTDPELNLLEENIKREKISVGRRTLGVAFNNQSVYLVKHVFNFIKQHIYETNIKDLATSEDMDIGDLILITDLYPLFHLSGCTIYPEGYPYKSPCLNTAPSKCGGVLTEMLQLFKMFWNKDSSITPDMRKFMANAQARHTVKEVKEYQSKVAENCSEIIDDINPGFKIVARIPTVNEYIESGERWINEIAMSVDSVLGEDLSDAARNNLITNQARLTRLREYVHCFEKIIYTENEQVVEKRADIEAVFNVMSGNSELVQKVADSLASFISRHTLTVIGIPNYVCPDCKKQHNPDVSHEHTLFTPVDPLNLFFTLKDRKIFRPE